MLKLLTEGTLSEMYSKTLEILASVGVDFDSEESRQLLKNAGASVQGNTVFFDEGMVEKHLNLMPKVVPDVTERRVAATSPFGNVPVLYDMQKKTHRRVDLADTIRMYQLTQTSELYECCNISTVDPIGLDSEESYVAQIAMALKYTDKWFSNGARATAQNSYHGDIYGSARKAMHLVRDFHGVYDEPVMTQSICPMSPLKYDSECLKNLDAVIDEKQIIGLSPCSLPVMTSPGSIMGTVIHDFAVSLAGVIYIQVKAPGTPVSLTNCTGMTDLRTTQPTYGSPEAVLLQSMFYELCVYKQIGSGFCGTLSDSIFPDFQSGVESLLTTLLPFNYVDVDCIWCYPGLMASWRCGSFEKAILDEEVMRYVNRSFKPVVTNIESELISLMQEAKKANTFLTRRTPKEYRRDVYLAKVFSKYGIESEVDPVKKELQKRVQEELKQRVDMYQLPQRSISQQALLNKYLPDTCKY